MYVPLSLENEDFLIVIILILLENFKIVTVSEDNFTHVEPG